VRSALEGHGPDQPFPLRSVLVDEEDDGALVQRCRDGDRRAFDRLVIRYQKPVFNAALRMLKNPEDARDVAQTVFLKVFEHLGQYDPNLRFYSWIYRIALNESINGHVRRSVATKSTRPLASSGRWTASRPAARSSAR
jgi:RNA polymerase sigma-70 factor (ECF subfamily)